MFLFKPSYRMVATFLIICLVLTLQPPVNAQDSGGNAIQFTGTVDSIDGSTVIVSGFEVDISSATTSAEDLSVGMTITVSGVLDGTVIVAIVIIIVSIGSPPGQDPTPEETPPGPPAEVTPTATPDPEEEPGSIIIIIEGPIESININIVIIFGIEIQIEPDDPILNEIRVGDYVRIEGTTNVENGVIIIVVVNIIIIQTGNLPPNCKISKNGNIKCSKKSSKKSSKKGSKR